MITLRPYQKRAIAEALAAAVESKRPVVVAPGGSGKTPMIAELVRVYHADGKRVLILSHRKEILSQIYRHLKDNGLPEDLVGVVSRKLGKSLEKPGAPIQVVGKDTMARRASIGAFDVVIVDECHHVVAKEYQALVGRYPNAVQIGFTATPLRMDGVGLDGWYDTIIMAALPGELIEQGFLASPRVFTTIDDYLPNLSSVPVKYGEYSTKHLMREVSRAGLAGGVVQNYLKHGQGKSFVGFSVTIQHSLMLVDEFKKAGIAVAHVDGNTDDKARDQLLADIREGKLLGLFNCMLLSEGWDFPGCEMVIMARPTRSLALYLQQASRGMRPLGEKKPIILDHARNAATFGLPHANRAYSLQGVPQEEVVNTGSKVCRHCYAMVDRDLTECPECGTPFGSPLAIPVETSDDLEELTKQKIEEFRAKVEKIAAKHKWGTEWASQVTERWLTMEGLS